MRTVYEDKKRKNHAGTAVNKLTRKEELFKKELLFIWILTAWICVMFYFNPRLLALEYAAPNLLAKIALYLFVLCLDSFWLYAIYDTTLIAVSFVMRKKARIVLTRGTLHTPPVAILYTTRNDFREDAVESCARINYSNYHLFILDDSTLDVYKGRIDKWAAQNKDKASVIRRTTHAGYKAGNLNHALSRIHKDYPFFVVCDADGILPRDFLKKLLPFFEKDSALAFAQTPQQQNPMQKERFGQDMGYRIGEHYRHYLKTKNEFGFVMFYGHGALLKTRVWEAMNGFPEIATEDLAFAAKSRLLGYHGVYTEETYCYEDFPPTYEKLRLRTEKWIRGTSEFMKLHFLDFARARHIPWYEKVDVLISAFSHYQTFLMLIFLLAMGAILPEYYAHFRYPGSFLLLPVPQGKTMLEYLAHVRYHIFWSPDFYLMMALTILCPVIPALMDGWRRPANLMRYLVTSSFVYFASLVTEFLAVLAFWLTGKAIFRNTHDAEESPIGGNTNFHPNSLAVFLAESVVGALLFYLGWKNKNLWFFAPATALVLSPLLHIFGWRRRAIRLIAWVPFTVGIFILFLVSMDLLMSWKSAF